MSPLLTWYGDDFTGSTDALDVLARAGLNAVLFLEQPDSAALRPFAAMQAIGLAGISRSQSPHWMDEHLPALFDWLRCFHAPVCHYKVCSTFDSSPAIGSIGKAIEIGRSVFGNSAVPVIAGAPALRRYTAFGHLFAAAGPAVYRIDRHPTMSRHPVTPMHEADLRLHLALQTWLPIGLVSLPEMLSGQAASRLAAEQANGAGAVVLDVVDDASLLEAGRAVWPASQEPPRFVAGSSGVEHSLVAFWRASRLIPAAPVLPPVAPADRIVVLSGSCSPVTSRQLHHAIQNGYHALPIDPALLLASQTESDRLATAATQALAAGQSVALYSALDNAAEPAASLSHPERIRFSEDLGASCGRLLRAVLLSSGARRAVIAGGDTSSHAGRQLGLFALTFLAPLSHGAPLCTAHSSDPRLHALEVVFKGGQIGADSFFEFARSGRD